MLHADTTVNPSTKVSLKFVGPFVFTGDGRTVFESPCAAAAGLYLWTIKQRSDNRHLIHYVGETTGLGSRHRDHLIRILGLHYGIIDPGNEPVRLQLPKEFQLAQETAPMVGFFLEGLENAQTDSLKTAEENR